MIEVTPEQHMTPPDLEWAKTVCKIGQGAACCCYLTMSPKGWSCEKFGQFSQHLKRRAEAGEMHARSDNCEGRASQ